MKKRKESKNIGNILFWAEVRMQNKKSCLDLGIFGKTPEERIKALCQYNTLVEPICEEECRQINKYYRSLTK